MNNLVNDELQALKDIANGFNNGDITKDEAEANILIELMKKRIDSLSVNYSVHPLSHLLNSKNNQLIDSLLFQAKHKAKEAITLLHNLPDSKHTFNAKLR
ncbi:hypothetical protein VBD025_03935 [Virgibacillus flavescens]|uniref:hypothetical protein n=1 Tax=Virgibacillus flavescens TaxID=1611422 RepID=UPI003D336DB9